MIKNSNLVMKIRFKALALFLFGVVFLLLFIMACSLFPFSRGVSPTDMDYAKDKPLLLASLLVANTLDPFVWSRNIDNIVEKYIPAGTDEKQAKIFLFDNGFLLKNQRKKYFTSIYQMDGQSVVVKIGFLNGKVFSSSGKITAGAWFLSDAKDAVNVDFLLEINRNKELWGNKQFDFDALVKRHFHTGESISTVKLLLFDNGFQKWTLRYKNELQASFTRTGFSSGGIPLRYQFYLSFKFEKGKLIFVSGKLQTTAS